MKKPAVIIIGLILFGIMTQGFNEVSASSAMWSKTYGGSGEENAGAMVATSDGGYALAGYTNSSGAGGYDFWLVKTDKNGEMQWNQTYGGKDYDMAYSLVQTSDQGYAIAGFTYSFGAGGSDFWLVKTDQNGNIEWNQTYGSGSSDHGHSVVQTPDGGYAIAGEGGNDFLLVKTDAMGNMEWNKTYGEDQYDMAKSLIVTSDGGYAIAGSKDGRINYSESDFWLIKTDAQGNIEWDREFSEWVDHPNMVIETSDGGYALAGVISFWYPHAGWLVKTKENGLMDWNKEFGSTRDSYQETANAVTETADQGFAVAGQTEKLGEGSHDFWLIKTDAQGNVLWNQTYGGPESESPCAIVECPDGSYVIAGTTSSFGAGKSDFWLIKIDKDEVIPEFPSGFIIVAMVLVTTIVITGYKKKLQITKSEQI
jgi:predicted secreted protein